MNYYLISFTWDSYQHYNAANQRTMLVRAATLEAAKDAIRDLYADYAVWNFENHTL